MDDVDKVGVAFVLDPEDPHAVVGREIDGEYDEDRYTLDEFFERVGLAHYKDWEEFGPINIQATKKQFQRTLGRALGVDETLVG